MGRAVEQVARERGHEIAAIVGRGDAAEITAERLGRADVAIEFTTPDGAVPNAVACVRSGIPVVLGSTGWHDQLPRLEQEVSAAGGALLWAPNFSLGVQLLARLVEQLASLQPARHGFSAHLLETHHAAKKDAPSGTAAMLARVFADAGAGILPTSSLRVGHVPGRHELILDGPFEQLRVVHEARDRRVFADGAVAAAEWLARAPRRGVFTLRDVLSDEPGTSP
jgi:4-hydroxy-tetrahydrodipicolinate reductase